MALGVGGGEDGAFQADDEDFHAGDRVEEDIVGGVRDAVGTNAEVVKRNWLEIHAGVDDLAAERGAG